MHESAPIDAVLCSGNAHKVDELGVLLPGLRLRALSQPDRLPPETGTTFEANALIKARGGAVLEPGCWVIADDSGLEVDALGGEPGVHSARYAGGHGDDGANTELVLRRLAQLDAAAAAAGERDVARTARFVCVLAAVSPDGDELVARGTVEGTIAREPAGTAGFGYDPVFAPDGYLQTFAELGADAKHAMSHRAHAAVRLAQLLAEHLAQVVPPGEAT